MFMRKMMIFKEDVYKCRICKIGFATPEELRLHRMNSHKGHMLAH